ncbi:anti-sigma regulatory factor (Ser/Thr protein kinase) [Streptomyces sp. B3I7]|uniref:ATP-binding protein n=1 Tax=Streptomyces sp. B3I7 TaxID=3042269 RepID=UPI0027838729|nr:ATP-binding protein [Streptomyces sp. B3I7]MDQ0815106.1 anti-sigma regulatory factor (Ser/Thr protein kinase) [Streptomyces sp. B3I7]
MDAVPGDEGSTASGGGPPRTSAALDGPSASIADARRLAVDFLTSARTEHALPIAERALEITQLVVSELVTNARKYAPGPVVLSLRIVGAMVEVAVWDSDPALPTARTADPGRVGQHGLEIVHALAQDLQVRREAVGKRVTALIAYVDESPGAGTQGAPW